MPLHDRRFQPVGPVLVRASTAPGSFPPPDLSSPQGGMDWLRTIWSPETREANSMASPALAARVEQLLDGDRPLTKKAVRSAVLSTASYLMRWQRRATPFGLFAGVSTVTVGPTAVKFGDVHQAVARVDADWLARVADGLEAHHGLRQMATVVADSGGCVRDGRFIVAGRAEPGARTPEPIKERSTRNSRIVQVILALAGRPERFDRLTEQIWARFPHGNRVKIEQILHALVDGHVLITNLRPPLTAVDGLAHLLAILGAVDLGPQPDVAALADQLSDIQSKLVHHNDVADPQQQSAIRAEVAARMRVIAATENPPLAVDVRLDAEVSVPQPVLDEAVRAAGVLVRLSTQPFGSAAWLDYHARFRARYGPGALVSVRDLVADSGLGYPSGYLGAPRARPAWRVLTERDTRLLALIQQAMLDGAVEIVLSDTDIEALTVGDPTAAVWPSRIELGVTVHAASPAAVDRGGFELLIAGAPRAHTSMAGRFAYLLDQADRERLAHSYVPPFEDGDVIAVQLSFPPRRVHNENVVRVGRLMPAVVSLSEHPDGDVISIDDLAVTADADQLYLARRSTGQRVIAHIPHALDTTVQTPPLARFIAEVADARSAVFGPLDLGAPARTLPYTPRIRYRRTVLAPARWLLTSDDLAQAPDPATASDDGDQRWDEAFGRWRQRWRVPARVIACHDELRLPVDLDKPLDRVLLRTRLARTDRVELREDAPADAHGWLGRPAELLIPMTLTIPAARRLPTTAPPRRPDRPGGSTVVHARLIGNPARFDDLVGQHIPNLGANLVGLGVQRWWVSRHRDMIRVDADQHVSVTFRLDKPTAYGPVAGRLAEFVADLHTRGLPAELVFTEYHEQPARYGDGPALEMAEKVFAADTAAAINQVRLAAHTGIAGQALAAASMVQLAAGLATDLASGCEGLLVCLRQRTEPVDRALSDLARALADPTGGYARLRELPGGDTVAHAWLARDAALHAYHTSLLPHRDPMDVLPTLLHDHHVRAVGVDPDFERKTGHLARAAAMRCLALAGA